MGLPIRKKFLELILDKLAFATEKGYKPGWVWFQVKQAIYETDELDGVYLSELKYLAYRLEYKSTWADYAYQTLSYNFQLGLLPPPSQEPKSRSRRRAKKPSQKYEDPLQAALDFFDLERVYSESQLKSVYRSLALRYHPDTGGNHDDFLVLQRHYQVLQRYIAIGV